MNYVGIDLGTTNSAICTYDGESVRLYKSPEQHDVTPSAIFIDKRGNKYVGFRAYNNAARSPGNAATLFKRMMGTSTPIELPAVGLTMTPEECSAEILRTLFGYLPDDCRTKDTGTVITVPAAFNQMQKDATMSAAESAGIGKVALMQEPVAAVMSVMRTRNTDGVFLIYDLGGGTLDIAVAESISGRVSLLAHGGIAMCGGRDFDRALFASVVQPWLLEQFDLPTEITTFERHLKLRRLSEWAAERAKIELSQREDAVISLSESELGIQDHSGAEIYLDIPIGRGLFDKLIEEKVRDSVEAARQTLASAGLSPHDVERIVFIGGPTQYKPLRDKVAFELGIAASTDVNPMTAVAEGAAIFAETIDWSARGRGRKGARGSVQSGSTLGLSFSYIARTPDTKARVVAKLDHEVPGTEFQIDSLDTGWSSGRIALHNGAAIDLQLPKAGENTFKVFVFAPNGGPMRLSEDRIVIVRTAASVDAIPASHSVAVAAKEKLGGAVGLVYLVRAGEHLPKKGKVTFRAEESLRAGSPGSLIFQLWEGDIREPVTDNRPIGALHIRGNDFVDGVIEAGAELICEYEIQDSGRIVLEVTVPSIGASFGDGRNFYSRTGGRGAIDFTKAARFVEDQIEETLTRLAEMASKVDDPRFDQVRGKLEDAETKSRSSDSETVKEALDIVQDARRLLSQAREDHLKDIRQLELDNIVAFFNEYVRQHARASEVSSFDNLTRTAQRTIDNNSRDFEGHLDDLRSKSFMVLWRQDGFVVDRFRWFAEASHLFPDSQEHANLVRAGREAMSAGDMPRLRQIVVRLDSLRVGSSGEADMMAGVNIVRTR